MPPRTSFTSFHISCLRSFHVSAIRSAKEANCHYKTLDLPPDATRIEIKRRYFQLSKTHHPDRNRNDPQASKRFVKISIAYAILGNQQHRENYDRDRARRQGTRSSSYSNPVGARPACGLSRRRTQSHGPPPSFFQSGGWNMSKRKPACMGQGKQSSTAEGGGFGVGGATTGRNDDVPHFSYAQKYREHEHLQNRWAHRAKVRKVEPDINIIFPLIGVMSILLGVVSLVAYTNP